MAAAAPMRPLLQVFVVKKPKLSDFKSQLNRLCPDLVYVWGGFSGDKKDIQELALGSLPALLGKDGGCKAWAGGKAGLLGCTRVRTGMACQTYPLPCLTPPSQGKRPRLLRTPSWPPLLGTRRGRRPTPCSWTLQTGAGSGTAIATAAELLRGAACSVAGAPVAWLWPRPMFPLADPCSEPLGARLREAGVRHVLAWPAGRPAPVLAATHFGHAFFGALGNPATTVPEVGAGTAAPRGRQCPAVGGADLPPDLPLLRWPPLPGLRTGQPHREGAPAPPLQPGAHSRAAAGARPRCRRLWRRQPRPG